MNIKVTGINFQAREDVLYGLKKAAKEVHSYSICMQPQVQKLGENHDIVKHEAAAKAYLDMVTNDDVFEQFVAFSGKKLLQNSLKKYMQPLEGGIKPLEFFSKFLHDVMDENKMFSSVKRNAEQGLIKRLSEL